MTLLVGALTIGLILSLLALGVYISFRIFDFPDITADGSITLGAAVAAVLISRPENPWSPVAATLAGALAGGVAGVTTGLLHTRFRIHALLSGILVMTALYSVNLHVMGRSNVPLLSTSTLATYAGQHATSLLGHPTVNLLGWEVNSGDLGLLVCSLAVALLISGILFFFFRTDLGTVMRATGDNAQMMRALSVNTGTMIVLGLGLSNALVALSGALLAQYQGFADVQMGIGMVIWGLASVIIGEALVASRSLGLTITGAVLGSVLFRLLVAIALRFGLNPNNLKLITALFVFAALVLPGILSRLRRKKKKEVAHA
jgi:putative ABC transport system permease protein